jgi:L-ribulose-5-phosphate 4-epimerase
MPQEGVIKFRVEHERGVCCSDADVAELVNWRRELRSRGLIGQDERRYDGLGFGNLSKRLADGTFLITASQTGHLAQLSAREFARIKRFDPDRNLVVSTGLMPPSSETMSHLAVYRSNPNVRYVFHVHSPVIWLARVQLDIPATDAAIECGTPEMFFDVQRLLQNWNGHKSILAMGGHEDGLLAWGATADEAGATLLSFVE